MNLELLNNIYILASHYKDLTYQLEDLKTAADSVYITYQTSKVSPVRIGTKEGMQLDKSIIISVLTERRDAIAAQLTSRGIEL